MAKSDTPAIYVAKQAFVLGGSQLVPAGATVAAGHPLLKKREHLFEPFKPMFDVAPEAETPSPGGVNALAVRQALVAKAKALGLSASGKSAELEAAIAAAEAEQAAAAEAAAKAAEAQDPPPATGGDA